MTVNQNKIRPADLTNKFNGEFGNYLSRIRSILAYYTKNPDELEKQTGNAKYVCEVCDFYLNLRGILKEKYGFDYGMSEKIWKSDESGKSREIIYLPHNKTGINVDQELLKKDSRTYKSVVGVIEKIRRQN
jgi:hypothetical protein